MMLELSSAMQDRELHKFRAGPTLGHQAQDNFEEGFTKLRTGQKLKDFIQRALLDAGHIHDDEEDIEMATPDQDGPASELPRPHVLVGGQLPVVGGETDETDDEDTNIDPLRHGEDFADEESG